MAKATAIAVWDLSLVPRFLAIVLEEMVERQNIVFENWKMSKIEFLAKLISGKCCKLDDEPDLKNKPQSF